MAHIYVSGRGWCSIYRTRGLGHFGTGRFCQRPRSAIWEAAAVLHSTFVDSIDADCSRAAVILAGRGFGGSLWVAGIVAASPWDTALGHAIDTKDKRFAFL